MIGEAAAAILDELIADGQCISVGWGRTLSASIKQLRTRKLANSSVVSLMGGLIRGSGTNTFEVATQLARQSSKRRRRPVARQPQLRRSIGGVHDLVLRRAHQASDVEFEFWTDIVAPNRP